MQYFQNYDVVMVFINLQLLRVILYSLYRIEFNNIELCIDLEIYRVLFSVC